MKNSNFAAARSSSSFSSSSSSSIRENEFEDEDEQEHEEDAAVYFNARPHLNPLPQERTCAFTVSGFRQTVRPIPPLVLPKTRRAWLLLPLVAPKSDEGGWEKAGLREVVQIKSPVAPRKPQ
jgi:hypothetical protein